MPDLPSPTEMPNLFIHELPTHADYEMPGISPKSRPEIEWRLEKAEERFEAGKRAYRSGDLVGARREFDAAVDVLLSAPEDVPERHRLEARLDQMVDQIYRFDLNHLGAGDKKQALDWSPIDTIFDLTFPIDPKLQPRVKEEIDATVSTLPLEENDRVLQFINFFSTEHGRQILLTGWRRCGRYKALIQRILHEEGVPEELISLAQAESEFLPRAVSNKRASGMWQFMRYTGTMYGLQASGSSDERLDPEKSTRAAARALRDLYQEFGDWYLAMAAYNCGPGCVERAVQRTGYADFWELSARGALPKQTMNYVPLILAITIMSKNQKDYGLDNIEVDSPLEYDSVRLLSPTSIELIADATGRTAAEIRELNPALLGSVAPAAYELHIPKGSYTAFMTALEAVPDAHRASWRLHRVEAGETVAEIAKHFRTPTDAIAGANNRTAEAPEAGDLLVIPVAANNAAHRSTRTRRGARVMTASKVDPRVIQHRAGPHTEKTAALLAREQGN